MKNMTEPKQKKAPIKTYVATTATVVAAVASMWFMRSCMNEPPIIIFDKAKAPCGCNERPTADTIRVAGPKSGPLGFGKPRDTFHVVPKCEPVTTKCPDSNAHRDSSGDCKCDTTKGYHNVATLPGDVKCVKKPEPCPDKNAHRTRNGDCGCNPGYHNKAKAPDLECVKNPPPPPPPCDCPPGLIEMPLANGVRESIEGSMPVTAIRKALVHDDKTRVPVIRVSLVIGSNGGVQAPPKFEANCPDGCDTTLNLETVIPTNVVGRPTEAPENGQPCKLKFKDPLYP